MDRDKIAAFKDAIKHEYELKVKKLKEEMEATLSSLSQAEETLSDDKKAQTTLFNTGEDMRKVRIPVVKTVLHRRISVPSRMLTALAKMDGDFTRKEFLEKIINDEVGTTIPDGTFAPEFSKLIKSNAVITVKEPYGTKSGIYRKANEVGTQAELSTVINKRST